MSRSTEHLFAMPGEIDARQRRITLLGKPERPSRKPEEQFLDQRLPTDVTGHQV